MNGLRVRFYYFSFDLCDCYFTSYAYDAVLQHDHVGM
jgi:hypothetical protein